MEKVIGLIYRFGKNDYQISLMDFDKHDQSTLMAMMERYDGNCSCVRGDAKLTIAQANVEYWEKKWAEQDAEAKRKTLAAKLYKLGMVETDIMYDHQADEQLTEEKIVDILKSKTDTAYMLEQFLQFCDGSQEYGDHKKFFEAVMEIVRYMEGME
jgi:hypothetical protein